MWTFLNHDWAISFLNATRSKILFHNERVHSYIFLQKLRVERAFEKQGWFNNINLTEKNPKNLFYSANFLWRK